MQPKNYNSPKQSKAAGLPDIKNSAKFIHFCFSFVLFLVGRDKYSQRSGVEFKRVVHVVPPRAEPQSFSFGWV